MEILYVLDYLHIIDEYHGEKFEIGVYSSLASAHEAFERVKDKPGFCDFPEVREPSDENLSGFYILEYELDRDCWENGFSVVSKNASDYQKKLASSLFINKRK